MRTHTRTRNRRTCRFVCILALARAGEVLALAQGRVNGMILEKPRGTGGFGYDSLFLHPPTGLSLAQMDPAEKLSISHRGVALQELREIFAIRDLGGGC